MIGNHIEPTLIWKPPTEKRMCLHTREIIKSGNLDDNSLTVSQKFSLYENGKLKVDPTVSKIKQVFERVDVRKMSNRIEASENNDAVGEFEQLNRCIRQFVAPSNISRAINGEPFLLDFSWGWVEHSK